MSRIQRRVGGFVNKCLFQDTILEVEISLAYVDEQIVVPAAKQLGTLVDPNRLDILAKRSRQPTDHLCVLLRLRQCYS